MWWAWSARPPDWYRVNLSAKIWEAMAPLLLHPCKLQTYASNFVLFIVCSRSINFVIQVNQILGIFRLVSKEVCPLIYNYFFFSNKCIMWGENSHHFYKHCLDTQKSNMYLAFLARSLQDSLSVFLAIRGKIPSWSKVFSKIICTVFLAFTFIFIGEM